MPRTSSASSSAVAEREAAPERSHYFTIEYYTQEGRSLGPVPVDPDFQPAREAAWFAGVRRGVLEPLTCPAAGEIEPAFSEELGSPYCEAVRVTPPAGVGQGAACVLPSGYFRDLANEHAAIFVKKGELQPGEPFVYHVCAYPLVAERSAATGRTGLQVEAIADPIGMADSDLATFLARSEPFGEQNGAEPAVFIPERVLDEACARTEAAGDVEIGAVIVGRLHRDRSKPDVFIEVTAQIPAQHAQATGSSFAFTPETWAAAHAAIELRGGDEIICGWQHSHPRFCGKCPPESWHHCALAKPFFSPEDVHLHQTCFGHAHQLALLISDLPEGGPTPALFGWRDGTVVSRGFHVLKREARARSSS